MTFFPTKKFIFNCFLTLRRKRWSEEDDNGVENNNTQEYVGVLILFYVKIDFFLENRKKC